MRTYRESENKPKRNADTAIDSTTSAVIDKTK